VGLLITPGTAWGVWILEFLSLLAALLLSIVLLRRDFGLFLAVFASIAWVITLYFVINGGNLTEEFALPLQFAALTLFVASERRGSYSWRGFLIGLTLAIAFLLRANLVGVWLFIIAYLIVNRVVTGRLRQLISESVVTLAGTLTVFLLILVYLGNLGALGDFWDAVFRYNFEYIDASLTEKLASPLVGAILTSRTGLIQMATAGWIVATYYLLRHSKQLQAAKPLVFAGVAGLPIEVFLSSLSGNWYSHYFMAWMPSMAILTGFLARTVIDGWTSKEQSGPVASPRFPKEFLLGVWLIGIGLVSLQIISDIPSWKAQASHFRDAAQYLQVNTDEDEHVLVWGAESVINFMADRRSPSRFFYLYPLLTPGYQDRALVAKYLDDIAINNPTIIIDTSPTNENIPPIDPLARQTWIASSNEGWMGSSEQRYSIVQGMDPVFKHLSKNYKPSGIMTGEGQWPVYTYVGNNEIVQGMDPVFKHLSKKYKPNGITIGEGQWPVYSYVGNNERVDEQDGTGDWTKFQENPVLGGDLGTVFDVSVLKEEDGFRMWFSWRPKSSVAIVESNDGIHWSEPIIALGPNKATGWEDRINRPIVVKRPDGYHMWYTGQNHRNSYIGHAISSDGKTWSRTSDNPVLAPDQPWEKEAVMSPHVLWDEDQNGYRMWYSGGEQYEPDAIGYAVSPDGQTWSKLPAPVFGPSNESEWESFKVTGGQVILHNGWHIMFYIGFQDIDHAQIGLARSRDGITNWQRHPANPIIWRGVSGTWDHDAVYKPFAVLGDGRWYLWYNGRLHGKEQIGLAIHEGVDLGFNDRKHPASLRTAMRYGSTDFR
jgi:predicted GH43/DUF377 family glycosyl hydrolase